MTLSVVVADDVEDIRALVTTVLSRSEFFEMVGEAGDGSQAVEMAARLQPDVMLLDLAMPGVDGLSAMPQLQEKSPRTAIVVLSSLDRDFYTPLVTQAGAVGFLDKGTSIRRLDDEILMLVGLLGAADEAAAARFPGQTASAGSARRFTEAALQRWRCEDLLDDVKLLVTELVANAVIHAHSEALVAVRLLPDAVRIDVSDDGPGVPEAREPNADHPSGRGLALVDRLARAWGVERRDRGKSVWFELDRPAVGLADGADSSSASSRRT